MLLSNLVRRTLVPALCLVTLLAACGDEPQKLEPQAEPTPPPPAEFDGQVLLTGELANAKGTVFLSVRRMGGGTLMVKRYDLPCPEFTQSGDHGVLRFHLDERQDMMIPQPITEASFEVKAIFSPAQEGRMTVIEDKVAEAVAPATRGQRDIRLALEPGKTLTPAGAGIPLPGSASRPTSQPASRPTSQPAR